MSDALAKPDPNALADLLRGETSLIRDWTEKWEAHRFLHCVGVILIGAGLYGAAMGSWRDPWQALFVAIKFPLIVLLTTLGNSLLNGMLAPLLGVDLGFRQSSLAILLSFTVAAAILGAFSPLVAFLVWNTPPMSPDFNISGGTYSFMMLTHVLLIAFAGLAANLRLVQLLRQFSPTPAGAHRVLLAWLVGNLFLGSQLCWIFRPFIGSPNLAVEFLRPNAFRGSFYETVFSALLRLLDLH
jgi:hypothetical protein